MKEADLRPQVLIDDDHFEFGISLPDRFCNHCSVLLNETHLLIAGGGRNDGVAAYILEIPSGIWTKIDDMIEGRKRQILWLKTCLIRTVAMRLQLCFVQPRIWPPSPSNLKMAFKMAFWPR